MRRLRAALLVPLLLGGIVGVSYLVHRGPLPTADIGASRPPVTTTQHPPPGLAWRPLGEPTAGRPPMEVAFGPFSSQVVVWIDRTQVRADLIPGRQQPGGTGWKPLAEVPAAERPSLVGAFNGGFNLLDAMGGFYAQGRTAVALVAGAASLVIHRDGTAAVGQWDRDASMDPTVVAVRQNLVLLVDHGASTAAAARPYPSWGLTPDRSMVTWRSALGMDPAGNLIYVAADLDPPALAALLVKAGCVRAMELDINHDLVTFNTYRQISPGVVRGTKLLTALSTSADRYLTPDDRDFVALYRR